MPVYENARYEVVRLSTDEWPMLQGEPLNWGVLSKEHGTVEATVSSLPSAILVANKLDTMLSELEGETDNVRSIN